MASLAPNTMIETVTSSTQWHGIQFPWKGIYGENGEMFIDFSHNQIQLQRVTSTRLHVQLKSRSLLQIIWKVEPFSRKLYPNYLNWISTLTLKRCSHHTGCAMTSRRCLFSTNSFLTSNVVNNTNTISIQIQSVVRLHLWLFDISRCSPFLKVYEREIALVYSMVSYIWLKWLLEWTEICVHR